jgi:hypothetical protein
MIWVLLWAAGVIAVIVFLFRGHWSWFFLWVFGLVAVIASAFLQDPLLERPAFRDFVEAAPGIGRAISIIAAIVLVADLAAMIVYTLRYGKSDGTKGKVITENRPMTSMSLGIPPPMGWSKRKILGSKSGYVTMESLVDGTATFGERMMVFGILTAMVSFFLIFVGAGLMMMKDLVIFVLFPVIPGLWLYNIMRHVLEDYQQAKKRVAARGHAEQSTADSKHHGRPH